MMWVSDFLVFFFFFQAEDGIRFGRGAGGRTLALPFFWFFFFLLHFVSLFFFFFFFFYSWCRLLIGKGAGGEKV